MKQFASSCERNSEPILLVLKEILTEPGLVLEIGSGTGQHAVYFARYLPHIKWQPSDIPGSLDSITAWREEESPANLRAPLELDLSDDKWPVDQADTIVCINTIHIVPWTAVKRLFSGAGGVLSAGGIMYVYGPYRYADRPLESSNEEFGQWLKERDPHSGIRDFEAVNALAEAAGLILEGDRAMPANNRSIWWRKR